jgi:phosphoadenosine phosphosulfate reductase
MIDLLQDPGVHDLRALSARLEQRSALEIVEWALDRFGDSMAVAASFQDCVLVDIVTRVNPHIDLLFLDTGFHFPQTLEYVEAVRRRYDLNLRVVHPGLPPGEAPCGTTNCCELRKIRPLALALDGKQAWMSGVRRCESPSRADAALVSWGSIRGLVKVNPLVTWTDADVERYITERGLPRHPLVDKGYGSIGCAPTTTPIAAGEAPRAGRWRGLSKTECGLHL